MTLNSLAKGIATVAGVAAVAAAVTAGLTSASEGVTVSSASSAAWQVQPVAFGVPMPLDPAADLPTADQLYGVLNGLADPGVPFRAKSYLVEGGIGLIEGRTADALMRNAVAKGQVPLTFEVGGITPAGASTATASVTASGPGMATQTQSITFVDQGGWKLSRSSASQVLQLFSA